MAIRSAESFCPPPSSAVLATLWRRLRRLGICSHCRDPGPVFTFRRATRMPSPSAILIAFLPVQAQRIVRLKNLGEGVDGDPRKNRLGSSPRRRNWRRLAGPNSSPCWAPSWPCCCRLILQKRLFSSCHRHGRRGWVDSCWDWWCWPATPDWFPSDRSPSTRSALTWCAIVTTQLGCRLVLLLIAPTVAAAFGVLVGIRRSTSGDRFW